MSESSPPRDNSINKGKRLSMKRLPKRLAYILRYGVIKEGINVDENGFVDIEDLMKVNLLKDYSKDELLNEMKSSISIRHTRRFDCKEKDNRILVRAAFSRNFEENPYHPGTQVKTLLETSMTTLLDNLDLFDLEEFQDEYLINRMIHHLKRQKAITNKALSALFIPTLRRVNLQNIYLTNNTLRMLWTQCPLLTHLSLKNCGYIITDTVLTQVVKNLPHLEHLNLTCCTHLTSKSLPVLSKRLPELKQLDIAGVRSITPPVVQTFLDSAKQLKRLDVFFMKTTAEEYNSLKAAAAQLGVDLVLQSPTDFTLKDTDGADECDIDDALERYGEEEEEEEEEEEDNDAEDIYDTNEEDLDPNRVQPSEMSDFEYESGSDDDDGNGIPIDDDAGMNAYFKAVLGDI